MLPYGSTFPNYRTPVKSHTFKKKVEMEPNSICCIKVPNKHEQYVDTVCDYARHGIDKDTSLCWYHLLYHGQFIQVFPIFILPVIVCLFGCWKIFASVSVACCDMEFWLSMPHISCRIQSAVEEDHPPWQIYIACSPWQSIV